MSASPTPQEIAIAYHDAWSAKDVEGALALVADDVVCQAPAGRLECITAYRGFVEGFNQIFLGSHLVEVFTEGDSVAMIEEIHTRPVPSSPSLTRVRAPDGKTGRLLFVFGRLPYEQAQGTAQAG